MALNFMASERKDLTPRITVFGVGGAGGNAVNNMIEKQLEGVEFVVANTDAQALAQSQARSRVQLGVKVTEGLGAGARPSVGAAAAEETLEEIIDHLAGAHMCFITAGMGGGTGTGAAPIIAQAAREMGVLTVGVVTKPFSFEGARRMRQAEEGLAELQKVVDTLIIIPNQNLFRLANENTTFTDAFALADDVLYQGVKGVTDLMVRPGMINLDFADVRSVMDEMGKAMMGTGEAEGEDRARVAAEKAIANPLLDEISLNGARGVLINITGGHDLTLFELDEAANLIREKVDQEANIIVGSTLDDTMVGKIRVSVVATGIESTADAQSLDVPRRRLSEPLANAAAPVAAAEPAPAPAPAAPAFEPLREQEVARVAPQPAYQPQPQAQPVARDYYEPQAAPAAAVASAPSYQPAGGFSSARQPAQYGNAAVAMQPVQDAFDLDEVIEEVSTPRVAQSYAPAARQEAAPRYEARAEWEQPEAEWQQPAEQAWQPEPAQSAPRRQPGVPSPETMQRLRAAVEKRPEEGYGHRPVARQAPAQPQLAPQPQAEGRPRFGGIGSLISRMAGHGNEAPQAGRAQPSMPAQSHGYDDEPQARSGDDRIEIPAFLRRQAN